MPGSADPTVADRRYIVRFSRTERALHWIHAAAFALLLASGVALYLPALATLVGRRPLVKAVHVDVAIAWVAALVAVAVVGDRRSLRKTLSELDLFDQDDRRMLRGRRFKAARFNGGQKIHAAVTAAFAFLFALSGGLLWLGERDTRFRLANTVLLHDGLMYVSLVLLVGHLYLAVLHPATRHSLRGMTIGTVRADWAGEHHPRWSALERETGEPREVSCQPDKLAGRKEHAECD